MDITECNAVREEDGKVIFCPFKDKCYRYTAPRDEYWQSMFKEAPFRKDENEDIICDHYWDNKGYRK